MLEAAERMAEALETLQPVAGATAGAAQRWLQADQAAARQWIENSTLPEELRLKLLNPTRE